MACPLSFSADLRGFTGLSVEIVPCLHDNYAYLIHDDASKQTAVVDPSTASPIMAVLREKGWHLDFILNTHHHFDHSGGNLELKRKCGSQVIGPAEEGGRISGLDLAVKDNDTWQLGLHKMEVLHTPGHTRGHCCFHFPAARLLFTGDTLFSLGCGRVFEGTAAQMWGSLSRLASLPPETLVFCGHEYTESNARFALSMEPGNKELQGKVSEVQSLRSRSMTTIPSSLGEELKTNPFLRPQSPEIRHNLSLDKKDVADEVVFGATRQAKDGYFGYLIVQIVRMFS